MYSEEDVKSLVDAAQAILDWDNLDVALADGTRKNIERWQISLGELRNLRAALSKFTTLKGE